MTGATEVDPESMTGFLRAPGTVWAVLDQAGLVRRCSAGLGEVLGLSPAEVIGRRGLLLVHRADLPVAAAAAARVVAGDDVTGVVLRVQHGSGDWRRLRLSARHGRDGEVHVLGRVVAGRTGDGAGEGREALVRSLLDHMPVPMFMKDMEGRYRWVNREYCRRSGFFASPDEVVDRSADEIWPDTVDDIVRHEAAALEDQPASEERMVTGGGIRDFVVARRVVRDEQGRPQAIAGVAVDITERVSAEEQLAERGRVLDAILQTSPDVIAIVDRGGTVVRHNAASHGMLGHRRRHVVLDEVMADIHPDDAPGVSSTFADLMAGTSDQAVARYRLRHRDGHWITVDSRARVERDAAGQADRMVVVTRDVTEDLASETRLRAAVTAAEEASQAKSEFLSRMSHELRTPLNSILGFAQLLQMDRLTEDRVSDVEGILRAGRELLALIDEVLEIARIETGHLELEPEALDPALLLGTCAGPADTVTVAGGVDPVWADGPRLRQVLEALTRAARHSVGSPPPLALAAGPGVSGRVRLSVAVGAPVPAPSPPGTPTGDVGIALALARFLVEQMGGQMIVAPGPVPGFELDLPAHRAPTAPAEEASADRPSVRLVVVSDDPLLGELAAQVAARRPGVEATVVPEGLVGPEVEAQHPAVVVVDVSRRAATGSADLEVLLEWTADDRPVVAVIGADDAGASARRLLEDGADAYLAAPVDLRALLDLVDAVRARLAAP